MHLEHKSVHLGSNFSSELCIALLVFVFFSKTRHHYALELTGIQKAGFLIYITDVEQETQGVSVVGWTQCQYIR